MGPWFLALDQAGVVAEVFLSKAELIGTGLARYAFDRLGDLYTTIGRVHQLAISSPDAPLKEFEHRTASLPNTTEAERLVVQRIG
jgi:hypothetical protein